MLHFSNHSETYGDTYEEAIDTINNKLPTDVFLYGEDLAVRDSVPLNRITQLDAAALSSKKEYTALIINDPSGFVTLSDEAITTLKAMTHDADFYLYYCGTKQIPRLIEAEIFDKSVYTEGDLCSGFVTFERERISYGGIYTAQLKQMDDNCGNREGLSELLFTNLLRCFKSNY